MLMQAKPSDLRRYGRRDAYGASGSSPAAGFPTPAVLISVETFETLPVLAWQAIANPFFYVGIPPENGLMATFYFLKELLGHDTRIHDCHCASQFPGRHVVPEHPTIVWLY